MTPAPTTIADRVDRIMDTAWPRSRTAPDEKTLRTVIARELRDAERCARTTDPRSYLADMVKPGERVTVASLVESTGRSGPTTTQALCVATRKGLFQRVGRGEYVRTKVVQVDDRAAGDTAARDLEWHKATGYETPDEARRCLDADAARQEEDAALAAAHVDALHRGALNVRAEADGLRARLAETMGALRRISAIDAGSMATPQDMTDVGAIAREACGEIRPDLDTGNTAPSEPGCDRCRPIVLDGLRRGLLSEGQAAKLLATDRLTVREIEDGDVACEATAEARA